jgi:ribosomal protein S12 methylthiotransferase accessory factor
MRLRDARVLLVGLEPWGVSAAVELALAGVGALHVLDDARVSEDDLHDANIFPASSLGTERAATLCAALSRLAPECAATWRRLSVTAGQPLAVDERGWDLVLVCVAADELLVAQSAARYAHAAGLLSMYAHIDGLDAVIGPGVVPGETACWECYRLRRLAHCADPQIELALQASLLAARPQPRERTYLAPAPAFVGQAVALAAIDLLLRGRSSRFAGACVVQDLVELESSTHTALPMPWCELCGGAHAMTQSGALARGDVRLDAASSPEELRQMLAGVVDARLGIVRQVEMDLLNPVLLPEVPVTATAVLGQFTDGHHACDGCEEPKVGAGKGGTLVEAMISAVGEAVERYSAGRFRTSDLTRASVAEMTGEFIAPARLCLYSDAQYDQPDFPYPRLDPQAPIDWTIGRWLDTGQPVAVPALPVYYNYPAPPETYFCEVTSNGLAAGASHDDAALRAALELIERDAYMISWMARRPGRRVLLERPRDPAVREILRELGERGVRVELYLLDVGVPVPVVMSVGYGDGARWPGATVSLSAHLSPRTAIRKAILEQAHVGPYLHRLMTEGTAMVPERPEDVESLDDHAYYYFPPSRAASFEFLGAGGSLRADELEEPADTSLAELVRRLEAAKMRIAVVDVTSPDLASTPFRVARAIGPDFQQIHFGHALARLGNPRLMAMAANGINPDPHPMA